VKHDHDNEIVSLFTVFGMSSFIAYVQVAPAGGCCFFYHDTVDLAACKTE